MSVLKDRIAVVTGASSGIGKAVVRALLSEGAKVCAVGRNLKTLESVAEKKERSQIRACKADISKDNDIINLNTFIQKEFGFVDILVHAAGVICMGKLEETPIEEFDTQYRINVRAPYLLTKMLLPVIRSMHGQIVFVNSSAGLCAKANLSQYSASKHALKAVADSLRDEVNSDGVRVLSVFPGRTNTPMQKKVFEMEGRPYQPELLLQPEDIAKVIINVLTLPRTAEVTDINIRPMIKSY